MSEERTMFLILGALAAVLIAASAVGTFLLQRAKPNQVEGLRNLNARIRAWWVIVLIAGVSCLAGRIAVIALFALVSFFALREFLTLMTTRRVDRAALLTNFCLILPVQYALVWANWYGLFAILVPVYAFLALPVLAALSADTNDFLARSATTQWTLMIAVYCISYVPALLTLQIPSFTGRTMLLIVFLLIVVQSSDVLQYIFGKLFGRYPIAPHVTPGKTIEGTAGGILGATVLGAALWRFTPFTPGQAAAIALVIAVSGFLGGLVLSAVKRDRGVKDWGHMIPGHGGILDRVDSLCFSAPVFFHLTRYFFTS